MKKTFLLTLTVLSVACVCSCTDEDQIYEQQNGSELVDPYRLSSDSAIAIANQAVKAIAKVSQTRGCTKDREVESVDVVNLKHTITRTSGGEDINSSLYIVNYKDDQGFAVVSADTRLRSLYAVSDTGHININDTIDNKGLKFFFNGVENDINSVVSSDPDLLISSGQVNVTSPQVKPLIWNVPRQWGQGEPYNTYCFTTSGEKAKVGCAAVAIGTAMTYHEWPIYIDDQRVNWHSMKKYKFNHDIDYVFAKLGEPKQLDMNYGVNSSGASTANFKRTLKRMGYIVPDDFKNFSEENVVRHLCTPTSSGYGPLIVVGTNISTGSSHAWVIDGYCTNITYEGNTNIKYTTNLFHCVWGWKGLNNGYFYLNDGVTTPASLFAAGDNGTLLSNRYKNLRYLTNFRKDLNQQAVELK